MDAQIKFLPKAEQVPLILRWLYESCGYLKYRMSKFEAYDLYAENKQFLKGEGIITFTDTAGRLMALKPDVTVSMVKNADDNGGISKYYYNENVFRLEHQGGEYKEISQIGIEFFGAETDYDEAEVLSLAASTLSVISDEFVLDVSHMGFISGLLDALDCTGSAAQSILAALRNKNTGELSLLARKHSLSQEQKDLLISAATLRGRLCDTLCSAAKLVQNPEMETALNNLKTLGDVLKILNVSESIYLDFSVVNDLDYYNGLVFRGYVRGAPRAVLSGGRYDNLMHRFSKKQGAIGFALYLSELDRLFYETPEYHVDVLLITGAEPASSVARTAQRLRLSGQSVRVQSHMSSDIKARQILRLTENGLEEVSLNA